MSQVYVDFGAVRIQRYLARTPTLRGLRAASHVLAKATSDTEVQAVAGELAKLNEHAGVADGVISLTFESGSHDAERVRELQDRVFTHLRAALPAAEFTSVWGRGESYLATYHKELKPRLDAGEVRHDLPPAAEFPLADPCRVCHTDPGARTVKVVGEPTWACPDCAARNVTKWAMTQDDTSPEGWLRREAGLEPPPDELIELARLDGEKDTHLATVAVDGNAFGEFFAALADAADTPAGAKEEISCDLAEATRLALEGAAKSVQREDGKLNVIPHIVGGDDVLVTVPASQAWCFTLEFLHSFEDMVKHTTTDHIDRLNQGRPDRPLTSPTASAGMVFAHASYPLNLVFEAAHARLTDAKAAVGGAKSSLQWQDVTADGPGAPPHDPLPLAALRTREGEPTDTARALDALTEVPAAHRARLGEAIRSGGPITVAALTSKRVGHWKQVAPFLPPLDEPQDPTPTGIHLGAALSIARWWTCA